MKVQAVNNTNFKGLFTNKTHENNGNWLVEYRPYSWENKNTSKMAPKERLDIFSSRLPDNEEIFTLDRTVYSKDIFGTTSYYKQDDGIMRSTITEMPAMNREESLRVVDKKLDKFLELKDIMRTRLLYTIQQNKDGFKSAASSYDDYSQTYEAEFWKNDKNKAKLSLDSNKKSMKEHANKAFKKFDDYITLRDSIDNIKSTKIRTLAEIKQLEDARISNKLIDISRRDIYDPNKALWEALSSGIRTASEKLVALPHRVISVREILGAVGQKVKSADIPLEAIKYVDTLIKKGI